MTNPTPPSADRFCVGDVWRSPRGVDWRVDLVIAGKVRLRNVAWPRYTQWRTPQATGTNVTNAWVLLQSGAELEGSHG